MKIITPVEAHNYAVSHFPVFPEDWNITEHFSWNEVFKNELKEYGCPSLDIFNTLLKSFTEFEKARVYIGKPFSITNCFRSDAHNKLLLKRYTDAKAKKLPPPNDKPAMHSSHVYGMAIDFNVVGMTPAQVRAKLLEGVNKGKLHLRIEANRPTWSHIDTGNPFIKNYVWGMFNPN